MKKYLLIFICLFSIVILSKYFLSNYDLEYKVNNHNVKTLYKEGRIYFEIDSKYNFDVYMNRKLGKTVIDKIIDINGDDFKCIYPTVKDVLTYPLCNKDDINIDYHLIDSELLNQYKKEIINIEKPDNKFYYYNNLDNNTYIAVWNYKGFIVMNGNSYKNIEIFKSDRYDNSLSYIKDNIIYMPDYDMEHEYNRLITLDITNNKRNVIDLEYTIDYDSYVVGTIKNNLYIFDNKHSVLYEINLKNKKTIIKSNNEIGYVKYLNDEFVSCSKSEYKVDKITFDTKKSLYKYSFDNGLYKTMNNNKNIKTIISNDDVSIIKEYNNRIYYVLDDYLYEYEPYNGSNKIMYFFELNFNKDNTIFIYNK